MRRRRTSTAPTTTAASATRQAGHSKQNSEQTFPTNRHQDIPYETTTPAHAVELWRLRSRRSMFCSLDLTPAVHHAGGNSEVVLILPQQFGADVIRLNDPNVEVVAKRHVHSSAYQVCTLGVAHPTTLADERPALAEERMREEEHLSVRKQELWSRREVPQVHAVAILAGEFSSRPKASDDVSGNRRIPAIQVGPAGKTKGGTVKAGI